jgi:hypothetical protein
MRNRNLLIVFIATGLFLTGCGFQAYPGGYDETNVRASYVNHDQYVQAPPPGGQPAGPHYAPAGGPSYGPPAPNVESGGPTYGSQGSARGGPSYGY